MTVTLLNDHSANIVSILLRNVMGIPSQLVTAISCENVVTVYWLDLIDYQARWGDINTHPAPGALCWNGSPPELLLQ
jgi:hypothetical protein